MAEADDVRAELERIGERRREVSAEREQLTVQTREAVERAREAGIPLVEVSRLLGISTQAIWKLTRPDDA